MFLLLKHLKELLDFYSNHKQHKQNSQRVWLCCNSVVNLFTLCCAQDQIIHIHKFDFVEDVNIYQGATLLATSYLYSLSMVGISTIVLAVFAEHVTKQGHTKQFEGDVAKV